MHVYVSLLSLCGHDKHTYMQQEKKSLTPHTYIKSCLLATGIQALWLPKEIVLFELRDCHDHHIVLCLCLLYVVQYQAVYISYELALLKRPEWLGRSFMLRSRFTPAKETMNSSVSAAYSCLLQCISYKHSKLTT